MNSHYRLIMESFPWSQHVIRGREESDLWRDNPITEWSVVAVTFYRQIREVLVSNLGYNTDYPQ
jgi:hypothetical protein